jgi:hypothetical protein
MAETGAERGMTRTPAQEGYMRFLCYGAASLQKERHRPLQAESASVRRYTGEHLNLP